MLTGVARVGKRIFSSLRALRGNRSGFTLVELLISSFILSIVLAALFMTLHVGGLARDTSSAKVNLQASVRQVMEMIIRDVRQTVNYEIANNNPSINHIKFRQVQGFDINTNQLLLGSDYIEYSYDPDTTTITRNLIDQNGNITNTRHFYNIIEPPFYTIDRLPLDTSVGASGRLVVVISGQVHVRGSLNPAFTLTEEVRIRNNE